MGLIWRICKNCGSKLHIDKDKYEKSPLSVFCDNCNMNKAGVDKSYVEKEKRGRG